MNKIFRVIWSH
ncbi:hypothetical protein F9848_05525, partial [Glaesserella parasuis]|nr:hypothetical protein [Glaesserella parasuis]